MFKQQMMKNTWGWHVVLGYAIPTFILVAPSFVINQLGLSEWEAFTFSSIPFLGRVVGALIYQSLSRIIGSKTVYSVSMASMGVLSLSTGVTHDLPLMLFERVLIGIFYGVLTSLAVAYAASSGNEKLVAFVMAGWAFGWIGAAFAFSEFQYWYIIALTGLIAIPAASVPISAPIANSRFSVPSILSIVAALLCFEPAFALQLAPTILEEEGQQVLPWMIAAYGSAVPIYFILPMIFKRSRFVIVCLTILQGLAGALFFLTGFTPLLLPFTTIGLALGAIAPALAMEYGTDPTSSGMALNIAALGGLAIPVISSLLGLQYTTSSITIISFLGLSFMLRGRKLLLAN